MTHSRLAHSPAHDLSVVFRERQREDAEAVMVLGTERQRRVRLTVAVDVHQVN